MSDHKVTVIGHRCVTVRNPDGHEWDFHFPEGWTGGAVPVMRAPRWARGEKPEDRLAERSAAGRAIEEAKRQQWV